MIDTRRSKGQQVRYVGPNDGYGPAFGTVGTITEVDFADWECTYKVDFPEIGHTKWFLNEKLEAVDSTYDLEHCGWRDRALKAEDELNELKKALKTLSEG